MRRLPLLFFITFVAASPLLARNVLFVDNSRPGGQGTFEKPYATLAEAQAVSREGDAIYVGEGNATYEGGISLKRGQMLIGAAFGLDAAAMEFKTQFDGPPVPAVQGPGPRIHGGVLLDGDNVVAGCTIVVENGSAIAGDALDRSIALRGVFMRPTKFAAGIVLRNPGPVSIIGGGIDGETTGSGLTIAGGSIDVTIERFPIAGAFGTAVAISGRERGKVTFRNRSPVKATASQDAIVLMHCALPVVFNDPVQVGSRGGRGLFARNVKLTISGGSSIDSTNASAVEIHDATVDIALDSISASDAAPGKLNEGIVLENVRGKFVVTGRDEKAGSGGTIRNAQSYGIRIVQSSGIRLSHMSVIDSGSANARCADATERETNVRCRAAMYLRHVTSATFEDIAITGGAGVGVNANNIADVNFSGLQIAGAGSTPQEPALLLQEAIGKITFTRCRIADGVGGEAIIEQRYNIARLAFAFCDFGAAQRPAASPWLLRARTSAASRLEIEVTNSQLHDNAGGAVRIDAGDASFASLTFADSNAHGISGRAIDIAARDTANVHLRMHRSRIYAGTPALSIVAGDGAAACLGLSENHIETGSGQPQIRIVAASPRARLYADGPSQSDTNTFILFIAQANAGARAVVESTTPITVGCPE